MGNGLIVNRWKFWKRTKNLVLIFVLLMCLAASAAGSGRDVGDLLEDDDDSEDRRVGAHIFNKKARKLLLRLFRRRIKIPEKSSLSLATQVSRPNIFPGLFNQEDGFITDAVIEFPMWLDLDTFADAMYSPNPFNFTGAPKASSFVGTERCFLYEKLEWLLGVVAQLSGLQSHTCVLKFICETQAIHTFYPDYPISIAFELIHLLLTPSSGTDDACFQEYVVAENKGKLFGRCDTFDPGCPFSIGALLIQNFFPVSVTPYYNPSPALAPQFPHHISTPSPNFANHQPDIERFKQFYSMFKHLL